MWFERIKGRVLHDTENSVETTFKYIYDVAEAYASGTFVANITGASSYGKGKYQDFYKAAQAADASGVLASNALTSGATTAVTSGITDPDNYRVVSVTGNQASVTGDVVISGTNWAGTAITDTISASGTSTINGVKAFNTITQITLPVLDTAGDEIAVGTADILGLTRPVTASGDVVYVGIAADAVNASTFSYEDASSVDVTNNTVTLTTSITDNDDIIIDFYASAL